ncbi:helix-turn-helix domain-containing protein [Roseobacter sp. HKCCD9010]|uniref:helix-turn-helix domain-containing protein n=1 Tax=unclassified Roseobacter TaxID=196798 RepID=UPI00149265DD|nr:MULTISPECIES: helix-turn-helix transcriptional regulator [unclassified Roseobacter]MBF9050527.1 helix-turn-helix domain-containing protein [Rhodobacterales bacterium HKCCD4356]NNV12056.1 helix-turn-helix domain-containing protein [Roseobacter sp. HKCCD7357]NNV17070.1 helix-turn-helix domain-containing protein [Roseobacter sp. HKCCD8768]NNV26299.1 helix-turn-helix domain-containing protein [Roseobacter sp. HKCCD8192]NNV30794.1 helix-turn-helix domain-containing protein [Roseobacter sp. HKCCD
MDAAQLSQLDLSKRLRELMLNHDLTVAQLAEIGGISKSAMEKYLAGPSSPRAVTLANICTALSLSPSWLMFGVSENDEVAEMSAFTTSVLTASAELLLTIKSDQELLGAFANEEPTSDAWRVFRADLPYVAGKKAYAEYVRLKGSVAISQPLEIKASKSKP